MSLVHINGIDIYYEQHGEGASILCIHGTSSSALVWEDAVSDLANHGRCIAYDRRGSFRSQRPEPYETTHVTEHTDDAAALLDALAATPAVVIGRSYGGEIALDLARRYPDKVTALALLEPALLQLHPEGETWFQPVLDKVLAAGQRDVSTVAEVFLRHVLDVETWDSFPEELKQMLVGNGPAILAELRGGPLDLSARDLAEIDQPTLIVSAKDSPEAFRQVDKVLADALPQSESALVEGNHFINPNHPTVLKFVDRFVARAAIR